MIIGAAGALQIAAIASTPLPQTEGYEQGGFIDVARAFSAVNFRLVASEFGVTSSTLGLYSWPNQLLF